MTGTSAVLSSVAIAVPGFIDHPAGTVTGAPLGGERVSMRGPLETELGVPVGFDSDSQSPRWSARSSRVRPPSTTMPSWSFSRTASAPASFREVASSSARVARLASWVIAPSPSGLLCTCGRVGCLETVAAGWAIRAEASAVLRRPELEEANLAQLEELREPRIDDLLTRASAELGAATAWLVNLLDPTIVIFADTPFTEGAEAFFETFDTSTRQHAVNPDVTIVRGSPDARLRGTIQRALELLPEQLRPRRIVCA